MGVKQEMYEWMQKNNIPSTLVLGINPNSSEDTLEINVPHVHYILIKKTMEYGDNTDIFKK